MRKSGARQDAQEGERERRRARSRRLPEPDQNPGYRAQFARQESGTEEEILSSDDEQAEPGQLPPAQEQPAAGGHYHPEVRMAANRGVGLAVREALVRVETGLNRVLEMPIPGPRHRVMMERPLIGGRRVPIEDPVWESFDQYQDEHRAAVARQQQLERERVQNENEEADEGENIDR